MKKYSAEILRQVIESEGGNIDTITLGMREDWGATASVIYRAGKLVTRLGKNVVRNAGISGSIWATPIMKIKYKDGKTELKDCYFVSGKNASPEVILAARELAEATALPSDLYGDGGIE
jgi:hypothetical protein